MVKERIEKVVKNQDKEIAALKADLDRERHFKIEAQEKLEIMSKQHAGEVTNYQHVLFRTQYRLFVQTFKRGLLYRLARGCIDQIETLSVAAKGSKEELQNKIAAVR